MSVSLFVASGVVVRFVWIAKTMMRPHTQEFLIRPMFVVLFLLADKDSGDTKKIREHGAGF